MNKGFYYQEEDGSIRVGQTIHTSSGTFNEDNKEQAPEGYYWFDTKEEAYAYFASLGNPLRALWDGLDLQSRLAVYQLAPQILTAFIGNDNETLLYLVQNNNQPELANLKAQVLALFVGE